MVKTKTIETLLKITKSSVVDSADGNFTVRLMTKATIKSNGLVVWKPPAIYKSLCPIDVEFFPFDEQRCTLKIGSWSFDGYAVDIRHKVSHWSNWLLGLILYQRCWLQLINFSVSLCPSLQIIFNVENNNIISNILVEL